jgi:hypothetical protein
VTKKISCSENVIEISDKFFKMMRELDKSAKTDGDDYEIAMLGMVDSVCRFSSYCSLEDIKKIVEEEYIAYNEWLASGANKEMAERAKEALSNIKEVAYSEEDVEVDEKDMDLLVARTKSTFGSN